MNNLLLFIFFFKTMLSYAFLSLNSSLINSCSLFDKNLKNLYKLSIREQILNWLNNENNNYDKPLSVNQFLTASKYCPIYKANKISNKLYNSKYWKN